jgi:hypothetical protein
VIKRKSKSLKAGGKTWVAMRVEAENGGWKRIASFYGRINPRFL